MKDMKKKEKDSGSDTELDARKSVIEAMRDMAKKAMGDKLVGLKKVTVAAPDKKGLEMGLEKAKELTSGMKLGADGEQVDETEEDPDMESLEEESHMDLDHDHEKGESEAHKDAVLGEEHSEHSDMSPEDLDKKIEMLMALKAKMGR